MTVSFAPFADDTASLSLGGLTVENGTDRIAVYGNLDLTRDAKGLAHVRALLAVLRDAEAAIGAGPSDPAPAEAPAVVANPFG